MKYNTLFVVFKIHEFMKLFPKGHTSLKELKAVKKVGPVIVQWETYQNRRPHVTNASI